MAVSKRTTAAKPVPSMARDLPELLTNLGPVRVRAMFGGYGVSLEGSMFGLIDQDTLYFKVDEQNRPEYEALGSKPFTYTYPNEGRTIEMGYWRVPLEVMEHTPRLEAFARAALAVAHRAALSPKKSKKRGAGAPPT